MPCVRFVDNVYLEYYAEYCSDTMLYFVFKGLCMGVILTLMFLCGGEVISISGFEVIVPSFLGYDELMIVRRVAE